MNKEHIARQARIFFALLQRDLYVMRKKLADLLIDSSIVLLTEILILAKLYPLLGMPRDYIAPLFIGSSVIFILFDLGYSFAMRYIYYRGYEEIQYHFTLPISKELIFLEHIVAFVIESLVVTGPLLIGGMYLLKDVFGPIQGSSLLFCSFYLLAIIYFGSYFFASSFWYEKEWFQDNMWPRRLSPLLFFSSAFYPWRDVDQLSPVLGKILLLNPITYIAEGMRAALLGQEQYIPLVLCIFATVICIGFDGWRMSRGIQKRLDPV